MQPSPPYTKLHNFHCIRNCNKKNFNINFDAKKLSISILVLSFPVLYVALLHIPPSTLLNDTTFWFLMSNSIIIIVAADSGVFSKSSRNANDVYDEYILHARATRSTTQCLMSVPSSQTEFDKDKKKPKSTGNIVAADHGQQQEEVHDKSIVLYEKPAVTKKELPASQLSKVVANKSMVVQEKEAEKPKALPCHEKSIEVVNEKLNERKSLEVGDKEKRMVLHQNSLPQVRAGANDISKEKPLRRSATSTEKCSRSVEEDNEYSKMSNEELNKRVEDFIKRFNMEMRLQMRNE